MIDQSEDATRGRRGERPVEEMRTPQWMQKSKKTLLITVNFLNCHNRMSPGKLDEVGDLQLGEGGLRVEQGPGIP